MTLPDTYVISLPERQDRRTAFILSAALVGFKGYKFFKAIKGHGKSDAQAACRNTHKKLIELAKEQGLPSITIMEDDAVFTKEFQNLPNWAKEIPEDWDMVYLGAHNHKALIPVSEHIGRCTFSLSTVAYKVRDTLYDTILDSINQDLPLDMIYALSIQRRVKAYCFKPNLIIQSNSFSDIEQRVVDYSRYYL